MSSNETELISVERQKTSFNIKELTYLYDGGKQETVHRHSVGILFV